MGMYVMSCSKCNKEYCFKGLFAKRKKKRFGEFCPTCCNLLIEGPILRSYTSKEQVKTLEVEKGFFRL